ncbi:MAG: 2Fe-2S iron-sulfur cluster binding domain-containing protein [Alphaproteobacteria bacterium]|nr:2Fe-2S iron-sulfur cluster binding domain-containing protein [Alphaproteobacteria bacterium]
MSLSLRLAFEDGTEREIAGLPWQTVFQAAQAHGIELATDCREGACATCKARCTEGEYDVGDASPEALSPEEEAAGFVLTCQMVPLGDCRLRFPYPFSLTGGPAAMGATLTAVERVARDTVRFDLALDREMAFLPGQYARIGIPGTGEERAFSFSRRDRGEFHARLLPDGLMSGWLASRAKPGDRLDLSGPYGGFFLREPVRPVLMVAGGTGLAPILAMLEALEGRQPAVVLFGAASADRLFALDRLAASGAEVSLAVEKGGGDPSWYAGFVTDLIDPPASDIDAYVCGPPAMIDAARARLRAAGIAEERIHCERFLPS